MNKSQRSFLGATLEVVGPEGLNWQRITVRSDKRCKADPTPEEDLTTQTLMHGFNEDDVVEYEIGEGQKGPCAVNVKKV